MEDLIAFYPLSLFGVALLLFVARWIWYARLAKRLCRKCWRGLMVRKAVPLHGGRGPVEVVWYCPECGKYTFRLFDGMADMPRAEDK